MDEIIAQFIFTAHICGIMNVCEKNDVINTHRAAASLGVSLGMNNAIVGEISRSLPEWSRVKIAPTKYGLRKAS